MPTNNLPNGKTLLDVVQSAEGIHQERKVLDRKLADMYRDARAAGLNTKVIKTIIRRRGMDPADMPEQDEILQAYTMAIEKETNAA